MLPTFVQLPLPITGTEGVKPFRLPHPIYQDGERYTHRIRWFLAEMSVPGLYREEIARAIGEALRGHAPYKYSRTRIRGMANLIVHVSPGAFGRILPGPDRAAAIITPKDIPRLHSSLLEALEAYESP